MSYEDMQPWLVFSRAATTNQQLKQSTTVLKIDSSIVLMICLKNLRSQLLTLFIIIISWFLLSPGQKGFNGFHSFAPRYKPNY